jgi:hypothetical protein
MECKWLAFQSGLRELALKTLQSPASISECISTIPARRFSLPRPNASLTPTYVSAYISITAFHSTDHHRKLHTFRGNAATARTGLRLGERNLFVDFDPLFVGNARKFGLRAVQVDSLSMALGDGAAVEDSLSNREQQPQCGGSI